MNTVKKPRNLWPIAITAYFVLFIAFIVTFSAWSLRQNMDLVRKDYYEEEVRFQSQMEKVSRTRSLGAAIAVAYNTQQRCVDIRLPQAHARQHPAGRIHLYRPSDAALDQEVALAVNSEGVQHLQSSQLRSGLWKVRLDWTANGEDYHHEQSVIVE